MADRTRMPCAVCGSDNAKESPLAGTPRSLCAACRREWRRTLLRPYKLALAAPIVALTLLAPFLPGAVVAATVFAAAVPGVLVAKLAPGYDGTPLWLPTDRQFERFCRRKRALALPPARLVRVGDSDSSPPS